MNFSVKSWILGNSPADSGAADSEWPQGTQSFVPVREVRDGVIFTEYGTCAKILGVLPVNFYLKSDMEKQNILFSFAMYLKVAPDDLQILVRTNKADIDEYCRALETVYNAEANENCRTMIYENAAMVNHISQTEALSRRFFLILTLRNVNDIHKAVETMQVMAGNARAFFAGCGLEIMEHDDEDLFQLQALCRRPHPNWNRIRALLQPVMGEEELPADALADGDRDGMLTVADLLAPDEVDTGHKDYIVADGVYHSYLYIAGYGFPTETSLAWMAPLVELGDGISVSLFLSRKRKDVIVPKVSKTAMIHKSRMRDVDETRVDYEELDDAISSSLYIKNEMNRSGEEFYWMNILIEVTAEDVETLRLRLGHVRNICTSLDMTARPAIYRHEQAYRSMAPLGRLDPDLDRKSRRNILTSGAAGAFPFCSYELCDDQGVFLGLNLHNDTPTIMDFYDRDKYSNGNISLFGTSGAGKTYLLLILAIRLRMQQVKVIMIIPEKGFEYQYACRAIGGRFIRLGPGSADRINIMAVRRTTLDIDYQLEGSIARDDSVLSDRINKVHLFYSLLCPGMTQEMHDELDTELVKTYGEFELTRDNRSLTFPDGRMKPMPDLSHLYPHLCENEALGMPAKATRRLVNGSAAGLCGQTNVDLDNGFVVIDTSLLPKEYMAAGMFIATDYARDEVSRSRIDRKAIISDEVWKIVGDEENPEVGNFIIELIKLVRGYNGIFISSTQNPADYFKSQNGAFGEAVLENSRIKILLQMEEMDALKMKSLLNLSDEETLQITRSRRGEGLLCVGSNRISVSFRASDTEHDLITTTADDLLKRKKGRTDE